MNKNHIYRFVRVSEDRVLNSFGLHAMLTFVINNEVIQFEENENISYKARTQRRLSIKVVRLWYYVPFKCQNLDKFLSKNVSGEKKSSLRFLKSQKNK